MSSQNTDLLPPIFDQVVSYFGDGSPSHSTRADIVEALLAAIVQAAAEKERERRRKLGVNAAPNSVSELRTFDRLSGDNLSRAQLVVQVQATVPLGTEILETALLLIECQIDLRLDPGNRFKIRGIEFDLDREGTEEVTGWCRTILPVMLQGVSADRRTFWPRPGRSRPEGVRILVEGLQLSATLRPAIPYVIKVDNRLIDPLLKDRTPDPGIRVLHISDLHLVEDITERGRDKRQPFGTATHAIDTARLLSYAVQDLNPRYDLVLATGDLTTDGARGSFETVRDYVQSGSLSGGNPMRIATYGLHAARGDRLLLPGNHDRYGNTLFPEQRLGSVFEDELATKKDYPYVVGYRPAKQDANSLTLLFFVFDSNLAQLPKLMDFPGRVKAIARGEVNENDTRKAFKLLAGDIEKDNRVESLDGEFIKFNPEKSVRIAVLHHHPILSKEAENAELEREAESGFFNSLAHPIKAFKRSLEGREQSLVRMEGGDAFLRGCFDAGVSLVLFGHQHVPYYRRVFLEDRQTASPPSTPRLIHCFCCASSLEHKAAHNGFYVFDFFDEKTVSVDLYLSVRDRSGKSSPFVRVAERTQRINFFDPVDPAKYGMDVKWISRTV